MKNRINYIFLSLILLTSILIFNTCKKSSDCDPNNPPVGQTRDLFPGDKLSLLPYKDFDTIKFIKNNTDTVVFLGGKFETGYNTAFDQDPTCPHADKVQYFKLILTNNLNGIITLYEYILGQPLDYVSQYSITFKDRTYGPKDPNSSNSVIGYRDSTKNYIGGIVYTDVYKFNGVSTYDNLYYISGIGIIKIIYKNDIYEKLP